MILSDELTIIKRFLKSILSQEDLKNFALNCLKIKSLSFIAKACEMNCKKYFINRYIKVLIS